MDTSSEAAASSLVLSDPEYVANVVEALMAIKWPDAQKPTLRQMIIEATELVTFTPVKYKGYTIKPISHAFQPFLINGRWHTRGFIAVRNGCHSLPAAVWFYTVEEAKHGIDCFIQAKGRAPQFWKLLRGGA